MLYAFFWVIPRHLKFICRRFGTLCLFHLHRQVGMCRMNYTSLRKGESHLIHNSLTSAIPCLSPTCYHSPSYTSPWPLCGSLPSTTCFRTWPAPTLSATSLMARLFSSQTPSPLIHQHSSNLVHSTHAYLPVKIGQTAVAYPGILFGRGSTNSVEDRENGDLGAVAP
jgi:hypothetical protein